ncbi:hypothetical protein NX722_27080 [Endozoicomonas gorgoniicola]|uniref:J domain-containing protein n=1 Tax=Endozoicomonas gorgoniicola TaxID=1234144 RepID=A0ABT3N3M0_9GAMM|nr:hypothetical protein [Endozoicomonas gorgoniicola]MCW7556227.1 hypothetical protein [Endozoicomonas gorgoniicola]
MARLDIGTYQILRSNESEVPDHENDRKKIEEAKKVLESSGLELIYLNGSDSKKNNDFKYDYFVSKEAEMIFYLSVLTGEAQQDMLNIVPSFYKDKKKAKAWRDEIIKKIHPDKSNHPDAKKATEVLNLLYERMLKNAKR